MRWEGGEQSENLEDRRRMSGKGMAIGGGTALVVALLAYALGVDPQLINKFINPPGANQGGQQQVDNRPLTPEEKRSRAFSGTVLKLTEDVWSEQLPRMGKRYEAPHMVLFSNAVRTGCGDAPSAVGPFYCPADKTVYLDPTFFEELERKLGGSKAEFSQAYVIAHEVGHHVQNLLGYSDLVHSKRGRPDYKQWSVRLELQADYLAGVWAHYADKLKPGLIEPGDIESAIKSANAIGDDRLQKRSTGFTSPESYTHGTSEQRTRYFREGLRTGDLRNLRQFFDRPYNEL